MPATQFPIQNAPSAHELWNGIGGHFDSLGQIINEFLDNSISDFIAHPSAAQNIAITLDELDHEGDVRITIEDTGSGITDLDSAFTLGSQNSQETPLNEHGFGMKHALATANPSNDAWTICTRTADDVEQETHKTIEAPYAIDAFAGTIHPNCWPGQFNGTGTLIQFVCKQDMFRTLGRGIKGGAKSFQTLADILFEDLGFVYSDVISNGTASISLTVKQKGQSPFTKQVGALTPDWDGFISPGSGTENVDLGNGLVTIDYEFGRMNEKTRREPFNNDTARKYYLKSMSSSGVELRINGRMISHNLFKEIWGIEKHNSYNYLLVKINLKSDDRDALPKTKTSKNGFRKGDPRLEALFHWIRSNLKEPQKDVSLSEHETDLFEELKKLKLQFDPNPGKVIDTEMSVFTTTGNPKDRQRVDMHEKTSNGITIYEGKKGSTTSKDVYQLRMYWDGFVYDGIEPDTGILVAQAHPNSVSELIGIVNEMEDAHHHHYNFVAKTWEELGIDA